MSDRPCPFCGAEVINSDGLIKHKDGCYIMVHFYSTPRDERDRAAWNKRPIEDELINIVLEACDEIGRSYTAYEAEEVKDRIKNKL